MPVYNSNLADLNRWWRLEFSIAGQVPGIRHATFDSTRVALDGVAPPVGNLPTRSRWALYEPVTLPDGLSVLVFAGYWQDTMGALRIKLVVMPTPAHQSVPTLWQLTKICPLKTEVRTGDFPASSDDVIFAGNFRLASCLVEHPFRQGTDYRFANYYPADWYLPFWSIYHKVAGAGLFFIMDDHETDPNNGPHMRGSQPLGFAPASVAADATLEANTIHLLFCQLPPTDYTVPGRAAPLPTYVQSGSLAVMGMENPVVA